TRHKGNGSSILLQELQRCSKPKPARYSASSRRQQKYSASSRSQPNSSTARSLGRPETTGLGRYIAQLASQAPATPEAHTWPLSGKNSTSGDTMGDSSQDSN
ncbi:hypothetical protein CCACVL1_09293, partial [Corchorus capsularis]